MANWKLTQTVRDTMIARAETLMDRRVKLALTGFPLDVEQVYCSLVAAHHREALQELQDAGVDALPKMSSVEVLFWHSLMPRAVVLMLKLPKEIFYTQSHTGYYGTRWKLNPADKSKILRPHWSTFSDPVRAELAKWINRLVREERLKLIVMTTIQKMLINWSPTVGHVHVRWPGLALLAADDPTWRQRFAERPTRQGLYAWPENRESNPLLDKHMRAADVALAGASMMTGDIDPSKQPVVPSLEAWQSLKGDFLYEPG